MKGKFKDTGKGIEEAGTIVTKGRGSFLALVSDDGMWSLPKGHVDPGEEPWFTAVRETMEETSVEAEVKSLIRRFSFFHHGHEYDLVVYHAVYISGEAYYDEHPNTRAEWLTFDEGRNLQAVDKNYAIVMEIVENNLKDEEHLEKSSGLSEDDINMISKHFNVKVSLKQLSAQYSKRPLYKIIEKNYTARALDSILKAEQVEQAVRYMGIPNGIEIIRLDKWIIVPYIEGEPLNRNNMSDENIEEAGRLLGCIHSVSIPETIQEKYRNEAIHYIKKRFRHSLELLLRANLLSEEQALVVSHRINRWIKEELPNEAITSVHWDFVPENIIITPDGMSIIDFESSRLFFPDYDVIKALYNIDSINSYKKNVFLSGYAETCGRKNWIYSESMELFYLIRVLANRLNRPTLDHRKIRNRLLGVIDYGQ